MVLFRSDQKMKATEKIVCDSSQGKRGSHPVQGHVGKCQGQLRGEEAREKHGQKPLFWFSKDDVWRLPKWLSGKEAACQCRRCKRHGFDPWVRKILCSRTWQLSPVYLPGKFHGQRSLAGYSTWGHKESDKTKGLSRHAHTYNHTQRLWLCLNNELNLLIAKNPVWENYGFSGL